MQKTIIQTEKAPKTIGPYSWAIEMDPMVFGSGQLAIDPVSGDLISNDIKAETRRAVNNLKSVLSVAEGTSTAS
jgi:2-iminobutanoate/2-iminopropanoate deaminase